ncbi:LysE family translocator [Shewanella sp. AS16]|uniref:LysE family translocator n=1 Tax=Shewanella sp. AS16 TaxID=2907625 RepID=UPI001F16FB06|nr:LysE family translocator [Shewanella sp. AS16]MCE9687764.1 LysE family translocator [Shewanella sp. AS16]
MELEAVITLATATALLLGSPGPAPLALAATSAAFGVKPSLGFLGGILCGLAVAIVGATAGMATVLANWPELKLALQLTGALYIAYVAYKIAMAPALSHGKATSDTAPRPTFVDGFILNILNPKAYAAFLALFSQFLLPGDGALGSYLSTGMVCFLVAVLVDSLWLLLGGLLRRLFERPLWARCIRFGFAASMLLAVGLSLTWI